MKTLKIGDLTAKYPIIQGGMGVGISLHSLAGAVAKAGGIGIISTAQIGFKDPEFLKAPMEANLRAIGEELKKAREIAPKGIIGFNIMVATRNYAQYVKEAVKAGADIIISGAGLPVSLPELVEGADENRADRFHRKIRTGHLQDVGPQVQTHPGSSGDRGTVGRRTSGIFQRRFEPLRCGYKRCAAHLSSGSV